MTHETYELSGSDQDRRKFEKQAEAFKSAIRQALKTPVGDKMTIISGKSDDK
jgi:hypothetical protein